MKNPKNILIWFAIFAGILFIGTILEDKATSNRLMFSDFLKQVENKEIVRVDVKGNDLVSVNKEGKQSYTYLPNYPGLIDKLNENNVEIDIQPPVSKSERLIGGLLGWLPFIIMLVLWISFSKSMSAGGNRAFGFGRARTKLFQENKTKITFADVAGIDEAKQELTEIVDFLRDPKKYTDLGARIPRGCLLIGSPGTGKTLLARAIAGEAKVPFFSISGSDFVEMFVGVGASRVRDMFEQAKKSAPCIIFIDEIDAVGRHRGSGVGGGNDEREQTLNQLLVEMDGFSENEGIVIIAATNRPDVLDQALLRPGRFDRQVMVPNPDVVGREQILNVHLKKIVAAVDVDSKTIARGTPGFAGADLANLINEAALMAARGNQRMVTMSNLEEAKDKIMMGPERTSMIMLQEEKELTAYHEGGHAIVAINCPNSDPIHKATIIPRGRALGLVMRLPERDRFSVTRAKLHDDLAVAMGGRAAEELIFGRDKVTTGASSDIEQVTEMAKNMVTKWGLSDLVGPINHAQDEKQRHMISVNDTSQETAKLIDGEIKRIVNEAIDRARKILSDKRADLEKLARALLEFETLTGDEIKDILDGKKIREYSTRTNFIPSAG